MKILLVNWSWYPTGGDWTYIENIQKLYELHGHEVVPFSTQNPKNLQSPFSNYFVNSYDFKELNKDKNISNGIKAIKTSVVSTDALEKLEMLLDNYKIDIAHLHNIHHYITPAIIEKLHKRGIKILWTLHDYKIICPENSFVSNGKLCEKCMGGSFYHCTTNRCKKNSLLASALATFEAYYYHKKNIYNLVDYYLCPSAFLLKKFEEFGFDKAKFFESNLCYDISTVDNFINNRQASISQNKEKYILYVGRLEKIKGIYTLIEALKDTNVVLKVVGSGNEDQHLKDLILSRQIENIKLLGFKTKSEIFELVCEAYFGVCPSEWYENFPYSIAEMFLFSKPVIGSNIGGIPELIIDGFTGLLCTPGSSKDLKTKILMLWNNEDFVIELGKNARHHAYELYNFESHWNKIESVINKLHFSY